MHLKKEATINEIYGKLIDSVEITESSYIFSCRKDILEISKEEISNIYFEKCEYVVNDNGIFLVRTKNDPWVLQISYVNNKYEIDCFYPDKNKKSIA